MNKKKLVQVFITTYNRAEYLKETIQSVLEQTYRDFEIIVLDNCSTDTTEKVVGAFSDDRIRYIRHQENIGGIGNISYAISHATSKYFVIFHDDDIMKPGFLEEELAQMEANPQISVITCKSDTIDSEGNTIKTFKADSGSVRLFSGVQMYESYMNHEWPVVFPTAMYRREFMVKNHINMNPDAGPSCDVLLLLEITRNGGVCAVLHKPLIKYRAHAGQDSTTSSALMLEKLFYFLKSDEYYNQLLDQDRDKQKHYYWQLIKMQICFVSSDRATVKEMCMAARRYRTIFSVDQFTWVLSSIVLKSVTVFPNLTKFAYRVMKKIKRRLL